VALRNKTSGTIHLRGIPKESKVLSAKLYWNYLLNSGTRPFEKISFDGNILAGELVNKTQDPCWADVDVSLTYVTDVTEIVASYSPNLNQNYKFGFFPPYPSISNTGNNPWNYEPQKIRTEGATLIVVYDDGQETGPLYIYDKFGKNAMFWGSASFSWENQAPGRGLFTMIGADGQLGHTDEKGYFDGNPMSGSDASTNSDWDGSDGWPLTQLWDTHTHCVDMEKRTSTVKYNAKGDCLVPVAFVVDNIGANSCPYELP